ncbi:large T antigen [LI polyomavirus]|uniref:DNA 3'-5' helicase n=1 Tax=LI polyomavirus TaxID=1965344 RepID=A0A1U9VWR9_9POLY|nr:large T antigen [LI polyomavirus]AQX36241.1 large T antigen [LI polyomavirus]
MDAVLTTPERRQLCLLLDISPQEYGNIPLMKNAFKKACLKHHPDKGGDPVLMMQLNSLWGKFTTSLTEARASTYQDDPIYGTPQFRAWWYRKHYGFFPDGFDPRRSSSTRNRRPGGTEEPEYEQPSTSGPNLSTPRPKKSRSNLFGSSGCRSRSTAQNPLFCDESLSSSEEEAENASAKSQSDHFSFTSQEESSQASAPSFTSNESTPASTPKRNRKNQSFGGIPSPGSRRSFSSTPPKQKRYKEGDDPIDFPNCLSEFLSHATLSNKTYSCFLIFTTAEKGELLYNKVSEKYKVEFKSLHNYRGGTALLFLVLLTRHRVTAIKNFACTFCSVSFLLCKAVIKSPELYSCLIKEPFCLLKENKPGLWDHEFAENKEPSCNWNLVADFACNYNLTDWVIILAHYLDFANDPALCDKCSKLPLKPHEAHRKNYENAKFFLKCKSQKTICQQAADVVIAKNRLKMLEQTREEMLREKILCKLKELQEMKLETLYIFLAGVAWYKVMFGNFEWKVFKVLNLLTDNIPKKRNVLFKGPINSGKTSLAAAFLDLLEGKALNINCPQDRLNFELGCAQDLFMVCFEDVKGSRGQNKDLPSGQGMHNLDNLRDHMDGSVNVNLEKKHQNKRSQIFPPSITTCNEYIIPDTVMCRFAITITFAHKENLRTSLRKNIDMQKLRVLQRGCTLLLGLMWLLPKEKFDDEIRPEVERWRDAFRGDIPQAHFEKMIQNVECGLDPLEDLFVEAPADAPPAAAPEDSEAEPPVASKVPHQHENTMEEPERQQKARPEKDLESQDSGLFTQDSGQT